MPRTIEEVARELIGAVDADAGYLLGSQWLIKRYEQLATRVKLRHLRQVGQVSVPATITTGTVSATRSAAFVTADATATATWTASLVGWHIRLRTTWYEIIEHYTVSGLAQLRLLNTYEEDTVTNGAYILALRWVPLSADAAYIGNCFLHPRLRRALQLRDYAELETYAPSRTLASGGPVVVAEAPSLPNGGRRVEFYPVSSTSENYCYVYWRSLGSLTKDDYLPPHVPSYALIEGAMIDLFRYKMAQAINAKNSEAAAFWRNEMRTQETHWERYLREMIGADRGEDDATFILKNTGIDFTPSDIQNARDHILAGWSWQP